MNLEISLLNNNSLSKRVMMTKYNIKLQKENQEKKQNVCVCEYNNLSKFIASISLFYSQCS